MYAMKRTILLMAALCCVRAAAAQDEAETKGTPVPQEAGRIYRTEVIPYQTRRQAEERSRAETGHVIAFAPKALSASEGGGSVVSRQIDIPYLWTDGNVYLHLENVPSAYSLLINDNLLERVDDCITPAEFALTPYIRQGINDIRLILHPEDAAGLNAAVTGRKSFENSYLYFQDKRSIRDFTIALVPDSTEKFGVLELDIIAQNSFNYDEPVTVGYDIYSPQGKLMEFNIVELNLPGRSVDTLRLRPYIYHTYENQWQTGGKTPPPLYKVMLFTRRDGAYKEYMPLKVGFGRTEFVGGKPVRLGKEVELAKVSYNAAPDRKTTLGQLKALKAQGRNTVCPDYPQPAWFYELCDELGLYVIDRANIHAPEKRGDRRVGGTPSNDPALAQEYLDRVKAMYYRSRNFTCVIAFALGGGSGNGYNMYKAYQWLKSVEKSRPVIYEDADGEWNSDL